MKQKPRLSVASIWNMSFGFLGIQMGFALQNGNASRILQVFGADVHELSWFWIVAPLTGLIVQPIIGALSDKTWTPLGRRRPFFLAGAILASAGLILMPQADLFIAFLPALWVGAGFLAIMDASFNVAMEPFRALVADKLSDEQRNSGFSIQTVLIGIGAVIGSWLPYVLANWFGISNTAPDGEIPDNVVFSFIVGAGVLMVTILITIFTTKEYSPEELQEFAGEEIIEESGGLKDLPKDFKNMPTTMKQLGLVQFFSWFGLFSMWVFTTPAIAHHVYGTALDDSSSQMYSDAADWVGVIFGVYNLVSAIYAFMLPSIAKAIGRRKTHMISLFAGGIGLLSIYIAPSPNFLLFSMILVGIAWASILAMPYAMLAGSIPANKMGVYMGIFNFFIVLPQIINAIFGGLIVKYAFGGNPIYALMLGGAFMILAGILTFRIKNVEISS
ncbi:MFS transporter [Cryomorphaceae bacterium 1068]|nr:MFS transporter [Cryomorphaceae bacterium 1068]